MSLVSRLLHPEVHRHLMVDEGEYVVDEVIRHWITIAGPVLVLAVAIPLFLSLPAWGDVWGVPLVLGLAMVAWSVSLIHREHMDRFVITNLRVFRVRGVFSRHLATVPMTRILDVSMHQPFIGRLLGYGHLVVRSPARDQGLREIRFVAHPERRDLTIQRVIQWSGPAAGAGPGGGRDAPGPLI